MLVVEMGMEIQWPDELRSERTSEAIPAPSSRWFCFGPFFFLGTVLNGYLPACFARRGLSLACIHQPHHSRWPDSSPKRSLVGSPAALPSFIRRQSAVKSNNWPGRLGRRLATSVIQQGSEQPPLMNGEFFFLFCCCVCCSQCPPPLNPLVYCTVGRPFPSGRIFFILIWWAVDDRFRLLSL